MASRIPTIRPIQLSALKALDPLHQEDEQREDQNCQADVEQIGHRTLLRCFACPTIETPRRSGNRVPHGTHAAAARFLTNPMRPAEISGRQTAKNYEFS